MAVLSTLLLFSPSLLHVVFLTSIAQMAHRHTFSIFLILQKAILECETEWATNKKLVDLSGKDVRRAVPKGLPYFAVDFGLDSGFAHVIEDEKMFPKNFAQVCLKYHYFRI